MSGTASAMNGAMTHAGDSAAHEARPGRTRIVVVGHGMVGQRFLERLVACSSGTETEITVFCEEARPAYDRVNLTSFFSGKSARDLSVVPSRFLEQHAMTLRLNDKVVAIDRERKL